MKRIVFIFLAFIGVSACSFDQNEIRRSTDVFSASFDSDTKTYIDDSLCVFWNAGDQISVFRSKYNEQFIFTGKTGDEYGEFESVDDPVKGEFEKNYAIYPYSGSNSCTCEGKFIITVPTVQNYCKNSFGVGSNVMLATTRNLEDKELKFSNVCGYILLKLYSGYAISQISFRGNNNEKISGEALLSVTGEKSFSIEMMDDSETEIIIDCGEGVLVSGSQCVDYWIVVPPISFTNGFTIDITAKNGQKNSITTTKPITINRNRVIKMAPKSAWTVPGDIKIGTITDIDDTFKTYNDYCEYVEKIDGFLSDPELSSAQYNTLRNVLRAYNVPIGSGYSLENESVIFKHAKRLMDSIVVLDTHCDFPYKYYYFGGKLDATQGSGGQVTLEKMNQGHVSAVYMINYMYPQGDQNDPEVIEQAPILLWPYMKIIDDYLKTFSDYCGIVKTKSDLLKLKAEGKKAFFYGLENGFLAGNDLNNLKTLSEKGVTYITLCHDRDNFICHTASNSSSLGLTDFGKKYVEEMNKQGIVVDISHTNIATQRDAIEVSKAPVVFSHSGARAMWNHTRNVDDETLKLLSKKDGVIQILMVQSFMGGSSANLNTMIQHINHCVDLIGIDHVGIGADFDGGGGCTDFNGLNDNVALTMALIKEGYSDSDIAKIWGENYLRVLDAVQEVAKELNKPAKGNENVTEEKGRW